MGFTVRALNINNNMNNNNQEDLLDILVNCSIQDLTILDKLSFEAVENSDGGNCNIDGNESHVSFDAEDLREWIEDDDEIFNQEEFAKDDFEPIKIVTPSPRQLEQTVVSTGALNVNKDIKNQNSLRNKIMESLKKLEMSMHRTESSRRQILRHKNQTRNGMSTIKFHKRESLISKSNQTRKRLSDFAPQTSYNMARNSYRKGTSLTYELEESRRRLSSLMRTSLPPRLNPNALTA